MKFHSKCGYNITLSENNCCAERQTGYNDGIVYSSDPLNIEASEIFQVRIETQEYKWAGHIRLGVACMDPGKETTPEFDAATEICRSDEYASSYWFWCGKNLHHNRREKEIKFLLKSNTNQILGIQVRPNGELHTYENGLHLEMIADKLPIQEKIFAVVDVYGATKKISYVKEQEKTLKDYCRKVIRSAMEDDCIEELPLPKRLKLYLKS